MHSKPVFQILPGVENISFHVGELRDFALTHAVDLLADMSLCFTPVRAWALVKRLDEVSPDAVPLVLTRSGLWPAAAVNSREDGLIFKGLVTASDIDGREGEL